MHVGLLECDEVTGRFAQVSGGYREMFAALLPEARFTYYRAHEGRLPGAPGDCDAWLCTGSRYSAYDPMPWVGALAQFIRDLRAKGVSFEIPSDPMRDPAFIALLATTYDVGPTSYPAEAPVASYAA